MKNSFFYLNSDDNQKLLSKLYKTSQELAFDTEFDRRNTYFPELSLIQIASENNTVIIDAFNCKALYPLIKKILTDKNIIKIFHSPKQDLEIFYQLFKIVPENLFDTQTAAKLCGFGTQISYNNLCTKILDIQLSKEHQKSNWLIRPLPNEMLIYAAMDVKYLILIYRYLSKQLNHSNVYNLYEKELEPILEIKNYRVNVDLAWKKAKISKLSNPELMKKIKLVAAFREEGAMQLNVPRKHFFTDEVLLAICKKLPISYDELKQIRGLSLNLKKPKYTNKLLNLCQGIRDFKNL